MNRLKIKADGYYRIPEELNGSCIGCFNFINSKTLDVRFCNSVNCVNYIWVKEKEMSDQKELEMFMFEYLENAAVEIEQEYYRNKIDEVLPEIKSVLKHHPLKDEIVEAVKDCIVSNGSNNIFVEAIQVMGSKLGCR